MAECEAKQIGPGWLVVVQGRASAQRWPCKVVVHPGAFEGMYTTQGGISHSHNCARADGTQRTAGAHRFVAFTGLA